MEDRSIPLPGSLRADDKTADHERHDHTHQVRPDVAYKRTVFVNHLYLGTPGAGDRQWVLVDAGMTGMATGQIKGAAEERFGNNIRPFAIVLTHGHVDHIGAAKELSEEWACPIYAHELEIPYLDGRSAYPPADPSVGGGMMARTSGMLPAGPFDLGPYLTALPADGTVPGLPDWKWIHVPGHSAGQVALWRESDRTLISADAFITTEQESAYAALTQKPAMHGPPMYFTPDWEASRTSVQRLAALRPQLVISGHGRAMEGPEMLVALDRLAAEFDSIAVPKHGKYVGRPATVENGEAYVS